MSEGKGGCDRAISVGDRFLRLQEVDWIYDQILRGTPTIALRGRPGSGKTHFLKFLLGRLSSNSTIYPLYLTCCDTGSVTGNIAAIEYSLVKLIPHIEKKPAPFSPRLLSRIYHQIPRMPSGEYLKGVVVPVLERLLKEEAGVSYQVSVSEATALFAESLKQIVEAGAHQTVLLIDSSDRLGDEVTRAVKIAAEAAQIQVVIACEYGLDKRNDGQPDSTQCEVSLDLEPFEDDAVRTLAEGYNVKDLTFAAELCRRFDGDPLRIVTALQIIAKGRKRLNDLPSEFDGLSNIILDDMGSAATAVIQVLALVSCDLDSETIAKTTGLSKMEIAEICGKHAEVITQTLPAGEGGDVRFSLYHSAFKSAVLRRFRAESTTLRRALCLELMSAARSDQYRLSPAQILDLPTLIGDADLELYVISVLMGISLAILIGNLDMAEEMAEGALGLTDNHHQRGMLHSGLSMIMLERGDLSAAISHSMQALSFLRTGSSPSVIEASVLGNLAFLLQRQNRLDEAIRCQDQALSLVRRFSSETGIKVGLAAHLSNAGKLYEKQGDLKTALKCYREAFLEDEQSHDMRGLASDLRRIGSVLQDLLQLDEAIEAHRRALEIDRSLGEIHAVGWDLANLGVVLSSKGEPVQARAFLTEALQIFVRLGAREEASQASKLLERLGS